MLLNKLTNDIPLYKLTQEAVLTDSLMVPNCVDCDIRYTF